MPVPTRAREFAGAVPDAGPEVAARTAKVKRARPSGGADGSLSSRTARAASAGLGNAAAARAFRAARGTGQLQPKLAVSQVDDPLEREAEAFSARVVSRAPLREPETSAATAVVSTTRSPASHPAKPPVLPVAVGRGVGRDEAAPAAPPSASPAGPEPATGSGEVAVSSELEAFITGISGGDRLADDLRAKIEPVLGADLSGVRVHADDKAAGAAAQLQARAFTFGKDIFLGAGESPADLALMAHESTHVVQQGAVEVFRLFDFVSDAASEAVASAARGIPGYSMISQIIGKDPISGEPVTTGRVEFVQALLAHGPFAGAVGPVLSAMNALDDIFTLISARLAEHNLSLDRVIGDMGRAWDEVDLVQGIDFNVAVVTRYVDALLNDVKAFVVAIVADVLAAVRAAAVKFAEPLVQSPTVKPYWDLGTKVFHYDPLKGEDVTAPTVEIIGDFLKLIGKQDVMEQMQTRGTLQETADWLDTQFATFASLLGQAKQLFADAWAAISPENLPDLVSNIEALAQRAYGLLQDVGAFAQTVIAKVLDLVKHSLLGMLSEHAKHTRGFTLLTVILGKDPFTNETVERNAENLIKGFITLLPNGEQMYSQLAESGVIADAAGRIEGEMARLNISWDMVVGTFKAIWDGLQLSDLLDPIGAFIRIVEQFEEPLSRIIEFVATVIQVVIELILQLMNFPSGLLGRIIDNAMAAIEDIKKDPIQFLKNIIEAIKQGVQGFFSNVGTYLLQGLEDWLFRGLRSLGITVPTTMSVEAVITLVIQVSGVTEETLWKKLGDRIGADRVVQVRGAIAQLGQAWAFIKDIQERGITAVWEFIQGQLSNLWDTILTTAKDWIMKEVVEKVATRLLSMLDPSGIMAVVRSAQAFFNAIQSAIEYIREILEIVDRYVSTLASVARGDVSPGADMLEHGLASAIPVAIGFLANQIGLGDVPEKIRDIIIDLRHLIDEALDWLFDQAMNLGRAALEALGIGDGPAHEDADDGQLSQATASFSMDGEHHTLTVAESGGGFDLVMSSSPGVLIGRIYYAINDAGTPSAVKAQLTSLQAEVSGVYQEMKVVLAAFVATPKVAAPILMPGAAPMRRRVYLANLAAWTQATAAKLEALGNANGVKDLIALGHKSKYVGPDGMILPAYQDWREEFYGSWTGGAQSAPDYYWNNLNQYAKDYWTSSATAAEKTTWQTAFDKGDCDLYRCDCCGKYFSDAKGFGGFQVRRFQLDHEPPVLDHFRSLGKAQTQVERQTWYNDGSVFTGLCQVCNGQKNKGLKKLQGDFRVKRRFRGANDNPPDPATDNEDAMDP